MTSSCLYSVSQLCEIFGFIITCSLNLICSNTKKIVPLDHDSNTIENENCNNPLNELNK